MKSKYFLLAILLFVSFLSKAQMTLDWSTYINVTEGRNMISDMDSSDSYYIGFKRVFDSREHYFVQKFDSNGVYLWQARIEPDTTLYPYGYFDPLSLRVDKDQNITTMLTCYLGTTIKRFDSNGALIYEKIIPNCMGSATYQASNGSNYFFGLNRNSNKGFLNIYNTIGNLIRTDSLPFSGSNIDRYCIYGDSHGNVSMYGFNAQSFTVHYNYYNDQFVDSISLPSAAVYYDKFRNRYLFSQGLFTKYDSSWVQKWAINIAFFGGFNVDENENFYIYDDLVDSIQSNVRKFNSSGVQLWSTAFNTSDIQHFFTGLHINTQNEIIVSGLKFDMPVFCNSKTNVFFVGVLDSVGHLKRYFESKVPGIDNAGPYYQHLKKDSKYYFVEIDTDSFSLTSTFYLNRLDIYGQPNVEGSVYYDGDNDCFQDSIEANLADIKVSLTPGNHYAETYSNGKFYFKAPDGNYVLDHSLPPNWMNTCPTTGIPITITNGVMTGAPIVIGKAAMPGQSDLTIDFANSPIRPGAYVTFVVQYQNLGATVISGNITFEFDTLFTFVTSSPYPDTINLQSLVWNFSGLNPGESGRIIFRLYVDQLETAGTAYTNTAYIYSSIGDDHPENNMQSVSDVVVGSLDPNEKYVTPKGVGPAGRINYSDSLLCYKIAFQNTGTDTAFFVQVIDTLDAPLDPMTYFPGVIYPPGTCTLSGDGVLRFVFDPVLIPDSTTDEPNSHGFINYFIKTRPNLPLGTTIRNKADIYFDYNPPVTTNSTVNTIDSTVSVTVIKAVADKYLVYPNPANEKLFIQSEKPEDLFEATLFTMDGKQAIGKTKAKGSIQLDVKNQKPGAYILKLLKGDTITFKNVVVIRN